VPFDLCAAATVPAFHLHPTRRLRLLRHALRSRVRPPRLESGTTSTLGAERMENAEWRVEEYRGMDVYVLVSPQGQDSIGRWGYEVRVSQEGADPADAGDTELLASGPQQFATRHAAEVAAFGAGYALVDRLLGPAE